jgi:hypothetical protein
VQYPKYSLCRKVFIEFVLAGGMPAAIVWKQSGTCTQRNRASIFAKIPLIRVIRVLLSVVFEAIFYARTFLSRNIEVFLSVGK